MMWVLALVLAWTIEAGEPGTYCSNQPGSSDHCKTGICLGPWTTIDNSLFGVCCNKDVGSGCSGCTLYDTEDNLTIGAGECTNCTRGTLVDGKCLFATKCGCRGGPAKLHHECCPACAKPCKGGNACVMKQDKNLCVKL